MLELFKRAMASGVPFQHELRLRRFDGEYRWFENRGVPIRDGSGRIARWYVLLTDIEDRTRALARLEQMQSDFAHINRVSMMGELAASLSHEITQPIASARNNARAAQNFLDKQPPDLGEVREALSCVVGDTDRAGDIVDRIRDHIKKAPPRKVHFDLNEAINEVIVLARSAIIKNGVWVQTRLSEGLLPTHGDRVQLQQVVLNLILNAVEAMGSVEAKPREPIDQHRARPHRCPRGSARFRAGHRSRAPRPRVRCVLHYEVQGHGDGAVDLPVHHRRPWGPVVGRGERTSRRHISSSPCPLCTWNPEFFSGVPGGESCVKAPL